MILGRHNARLSAIQDSTTVDKWVGDAEAYLDETLLEGEDRLGELWRCYLVIPSNLPVVIAPGDFVVYEKGGQTHTREVRDLTERPLFGVLRLHFADR